MKILLFGKNGQLGWELRRSLASLGELLALGSDDEGGSLLQLDALQARVQSFGPDVIVNAAAHTAVDRAESEPDVARMINATAPGVLAQAAYQLNAWLVHYSTDYVFDGSGSTAWREADPTGPLSVYGRSKLEGEDLIRKSGARYLILRTSWVYGTRGGNFAKTMLRLARERETLKVVADQIGAPTGADLLADVSAHALRRVLIDPQLGGLYHVAASGETSWYEYARFVLAHAPATMLPLKAGPDGIQAVPSSAYLTAAARPRNSRLDTTRFSSAFGLRLPPWQEGVERMLTELNQQSPA